MKTTVYGKEAIEAVTGKHEKQTTNGKNFVSLVAAGAWTIVNFTYGGKRKCECCGRPITRVLHLKNQSHEAAKKRDRAYAFAEEITIGIVCGPKLFIESCRGFYEDPQREWERQHQTWKTYIEYVMLSAQGRAFWNALPETLTRDIDSYLEEGFKDAQHSGVWWQARDAKRGFLKTCLNDKSRRVYNHRFLYVPVNRLCSARERIKNDVMALDKETTCIRVFEALEQERIKQSSKNA